MIEQAIEAEQVYLQKRLEGEDVALDLSEYGYENLDAYFADKRDYQFHALDYTEMWTTDEKAFADIAAILQAEKPVLLFEKHPEPFIYLGSKDYDAAAIEASGIKAYDGGYLGGTIVGGTGDLSVGIFFPKEIDVRADHIINELVGILIVNGVNAYKDNNDIMLDGRKVAGTARLETDTYYGFVAYVSFSDNAELVRQICGDSEKKPSFISSMTADAFVEAVRQWLL